MECISSTFYPYCSRMTDISRIVCTLVAYNSSDFICRVRFAIIQSCHAQFVAVARSTWQIQGTRRRSDELHDELVEVACACGL